MKKHFNRPALRATDVWRWIEKGMLNVAAIKDSRIFYLTQGRSVRQKWLKKIKGKVLTKTAVTYLRKGSFLVPIWRKVPQWEIDFLLEQNIPPNQNGIVHYGQQYYRLYYMQVEDLDRARRQQDHILDHYLPELLANFPDFWQNLSRQDQIIQRIGDRKVSTDNLFAIVEIRLKSISASLNSIRANSPLFRQGFAEEKKQKSAQTAIAYFLKTAQECRTFVFRPVYRRLYYAARSLELAASHIRNGRLDLAKARLKSALKNLKYPTET